MADETPVRKIVGLCSIQIDNLIPIQREGEVRLPTEVFIRQIHRVDGYLEASVLCRSYILKYAAVTVHLSHLLLENQIGSPSEIHIQIT
jgi:hypothetical protein